MKPLSTAYVHIGFEKTGSTSLFATLKASRAALLERGVLFVDIPDIHVALPFALGAKSDARRTRLKLETTEAERAVTRATLATLEDQLGRFDGDTVVVSSEMLAGLSDGPLDRLRSLLGRYVHEVRVVAYVRHPVAQAVSLSQQLVKTGSMTRVEAEADPKRRLFAPRLSTFVDVFGRDNVIVRPFETGSLVGGRIQSDFLHTIGYDGPREAVTTVDSNMGLSMPALILKDLMNQQVGDRLPTWQALYGLPGRKFSLPQDALDKAASGGRADIAYLRDIFGLEFADPAIEERQPLRSYFTDDVMAALRALPFATLRRPKVRLAFKVAMAAIRNGNYDAPRPSDVAAARRELVIDRGRAVGRAAASLIKPQASRDASGAVNVPDRSRS